ncbi:MAG: leucine-rich repeat domain-containing protein [Clostridia bacterium]|nr:leucine-rich repeat domain-containing protein [Clostridia bacterium]
MKKGRALCLLLAAACFWMALVPAAGSADFDISGDVLVSYHGSESSVNVPDGVRVIGSGAFAGNQSLVTVVLPGSVKEIGSGAFRNCVHLQYVITGGLSVIGSYAFDGCPMLNDSFRYDAANVSDTAFGKAAETKTAAQADSAAGKAETGAFAYCGAFADP